MSCDILELNVLPHGANNKFNDDVYSSQSKADLLMRLLACQWIARVSASVVQNIKEIRVIQ